MRRKCQLYYTGKTEIKPRKPDSAPSPSQALYCKVGVDGVEISGEDTLRDTDPQFGNLSLGVGFIDAVN